MKLTFWMRDSIRLPGHVAEDAKVPCPACGEPCVHVQPRVNDDTDTLRPTYVFRCEGFHEWAILKGKAVLRLVTRGKKVITNWESHT